MMALADLCPVERGPNHAGRRSRTNDIPKIYDYMNVENIHDSSFAESIPDTFVEQARALANWHEYGVFSDSKLDGIGNSASYF